MSPSADILITNARLFTADEARPAAQAAAVQGNRIAFVGDMQTADEWRRASTRVIDAAGKTLLPGFIDCHYHLLMGSLELDDIHAEAATSYEDLSGIVRIFAAQNPGKIWLSGFGVRYNLGPGHIPLTRQHLDAILPDRPLYLMAYDGHTSWANTLALQKAGVLHGADCGANSWVMLDEHGEATGELREDGAQERIERMIPKPGEAGKRSLLKKGLRLASSLGITSVHNMDGDEEQAALYAAFEEAGDLTVRVYVPYSLQPSTPFEDIEKKAAALKRKYRSPMVRSGCVKLFMDGVIESCTGLMVNEYTDQSGTCGGSNYEAGQFECFVLEADRLELQIFVHAVGDGGVRRVLDTYAAARRTNGRRDSRHRIEHIELIHPDDVSRFADLEVIASMQPLHAPPKKDESDIWLRRVGEGRWPFSFAWSTLRGAGARLVFGSDWSVVSPDPLLGIRNALNRLPWKEGMPHHRQTLAEALLSYTRDAAYAEFQEGVKGQLKPGYLADLVLLSEDILQLPPEQIKTVKALLTIMDGRIVHEA